MYNYKLYKNIFTHFYIEKKPRSLSDFQRNFYKTSIALDSNRS